MVLNVRTNLGLVRIYTIVVGLLALLGLFVYGHLFQIINTDISIDLIRVLLTFYLLYVSVVAKDDHSVNAALRVVGILYLGIGLLGLVSSTLGGFLPAGLTSFDIVFHLVTGGLAAYAGAGSHKHVAAH